MIGINVIDFKNPYKKDRNLFKSNLFSPNSTASSALNSPANAETSPVSAASPSSPSCQKLSKYQWWESKIAQELVNPLMYSLEILADSGCLLVWNLGISTRLHVGLVLCLIYSFHKVILASCHNCQVLVCKGYRRKVGLEMIYKIQDEFQLLAYLEELNLANSADNTTNNSSNMPNFSHNPIFNKLAGSLLSPSNKLNDSGLGDVDKSFTGWNAGHSPYQSNKKDNQFNSTLEIIPTGTILDKKWFIKCLNRGNDRYYSKVMGDYLKYESKKNQKSTEKI